LKKKNTRELKKLLGSHTNIDDRRIVKIETVKQEADEIKTFFFTDELCSFAKPGEFVMVWVMGTDEVPMSLSSINHSGLSSITVARIGEATNRLHAIKIGEKIGVRGPYGNGFELLDGKTLLVGGGIGLAPLMPLINLLSEKRREFTLIAGARTKSALPFIEIINSLRKNHEICVTTDDGSYGNCGTTISYFEDIVKDDFFDHVYTCGPEEMMWKIFQITENYNLPIQACLERYMKCGLGICGHCVLEPVGLRVCRDGPVFTSDVLRRIEDFGRYKKGPDGRTIPI
jgi:dihydroorotate dehydrogenase electron transfer subunit